MCLSTRTTQSNFASKQKQMNLIVNNPYNNGEHESRLQYFDYESNNNDRLDLIHSLHPETIKWQNKPYTEWSQADLFHWIFSVTTENKKNYEDDINLENFINIFPKQLKNLSKTDFVNLSESEECGELLYLSKEKLIKQIEDKKYLSDRCQLIKRQRGRPRKITHSGRDKHTESAKCKLWEFLRNLLHNPETCPHLIKWDNFNEGTFKFVQSEEVAKLWGGRNHKQNTKMNYEKLSRAMRYYYKDEVLKPVCGKRLVYKFGPNATGWKVINPIL